MRTLLAALWILVSFSAQAALESKALRFRMSVEPNTLDWNLAYTSNETHIIMNVMEGLVEEGPEMKPQPALASKWDISPDGRTYTFHLREGVKWSDGKPLRASDFEASWLRLLSPKTKSDYAAFLYDIENAEDYHLGKIKDASKVGVKAIGEDKFQVKLRRTVPYFLHLPTFWVTFPIRTDLIKKWGDQWATPGKIVTLGPYLLKQWTKGKSLTLQRNPKYFGAAPTVEQVEVTIEPDDHRARGLFYGDKLDFLLEATTADMLRVRAGSDRGQTRVEQFPYLATYYLGFLVDSGPLQNPLTRQAISTAIALERPAIPSALQGGQMAAKGWIPPGMMGHDPNGGTVGTLYDAKAKLAQAGYFEGKGFPRLPLWVEKFDGADKLKDFISKVLREKLGIEVEAHVGPMTDYDKFRQAGRNALFVAHWGADFPDPANFFEVFGAGGIGRKRTNWTSAAYDDLLGQAAKSLDSLKRLALYSDAEKLMVEKDAVMLPLFYKRNAVLLGARISKFQISPLNYLFFKKVELKR